MTGLAILLLTILVSFTVVKVGTVALRITGLDERTASFQALSAFSGTGFTTREAEKVVGHFQRRRIVRGLIILGNAGLATVIASAIATFRGGEETINLLVKLAVLGLGLLIFYNLAVAKRLNRWISAYIQRRLERYTDLGLVEFEEVLDLGKERSIASVEIHEGNPVADKTLAETGLSRAGVNVLAIERGRELLPTLNATTRIEPGDRLIAFGNTARMKEVSHGGYEPPPPETGRVEELLALGSSHRIHEISVVEGELAGKSLRELELTKSKVLVLGRRHRGTFDPAPGADTRLAEGDQIICYGPIEALKALEKEEA